MICVLGVDLQTSRCPQPPAWFLTHQSHLSPSPPRAWPAFCTISKFLSEAWWSHLTPLASNMVLFYFDNKTWRAELCAFEINYFSNASDCHFNKATEKLKQQKIWISESGQNVIVSELLATVFIVSLREVSKKSLTIPHWSPLPLNMIFFFRFFGRFLLIFVKVGNHSKWK